MNRWIHEERTWQNNIHYPKVTPKYLGISHCKREACRWVQGGTCRLHTLQAIQLLASLLSKVLAAEQKQLIAFWVHSHRNNEICQTFNQNRSNTTSRIPGLCILFLCCSVGGSILKAIIAMNEMRQLPWIILCRRHQVLCPSIWTAGNTKGIVSDGQPNLLETFKGPIQPFYVVRDSRLASYPPSVRAELSSGGASDVDQRGTSTAGQETCANHNFATNRRKISEIFGASWYRWNSI